jgi:hypothetical protein
LIINTHKQFENCKNKQCLYSILNDCFEWFFLLLINSGRKTLITL